MIKTNSCDLPSNKPFPYTWFAIITALALTLVLLHLTAPYGKGIALLWDTLVRYTPSNYQHLITYYTYLPRLTVALLSGFALAVAGCVFQFVLRNPLASPTTLGIAAGAELGKVAAVLWLPAQWLMPDFIPTFLGGLIATGLVFVLSSSRGYAPLHMVLSGMVVSLFLGSTNTILLMLNEQQLSSIFVWGAGDLNQNSWSITLQLLPMIFIPTLLLLLFQRPLSTLQFGDSVASSLGINIRVVKILCLSLAIFITASVVSEVGLIGFIGIVAPTMTRLFGVRPLRQQIITSGFLGSWLLLIVDLIVQPLSGVGGEMLPTGAMTALIGAPCLLWLLKHLPLASDLKMHSSAQQHYHHMNAFRQGFYLTLVLVVLVLMALTIGRDSYGWSFDWTPAIFDLRVPRISVALLAGIGLAIAGLLIQRMTTNPMASPEILGISSGAALTLVVGSLFGVALTREQQMFWGTLGALSVTGLIAWLGKKHQFAPTQTLLTGIALSAGLDAILRIAISTGKDNAAALLTWLSGSTYLVTYQDVALLATGVIILFIISLSLHRWVELISLGQVTAQSLGLPVTWVRLILLLLIAAITTLCTIVMGPLSFVGLLAPHMARSLHQYRALPQMVISALIGAIVLVGADWIGRTVWFPWQFPAGLFASLLGGAYFLYLMRR